MSEVASEIDELILRIVLESEHGPAWLEQVAKGDELAGLLLDLRKRGLSDRLVAEMWMAGDLTTARDMVGLSSAQIADLNAAARVWA